MQQKRRVSINSAIIGCILLYTVAGVSGNQARIDESIKELKGHVNAMQTVRDGLAVRVERRNDPSSRTYKLTFERLLPWNDRFGNNQWSDFSFEIMRNGSRLTALPVANPAGRGAESRMPCYIDVSELSITDSGIEGVLRITISDRRPRVAELRVKGVIDDGNIRGAYRSDGSGGIQGPRQERFYGGVEDATVRVFSQTVKEPDGITSLAEERYNEALALERKSAGLYDDIRALHLALDKGLSYAHASRIAVAPDVEFDPLPEPGAPPGAGRRRAAAVPSMDALLDASMDDFSLGVPGGAAADTGADEEKAKAIRERLEKIIAAVASRRGIAEKSVAARGSSVISGSQDSGDLDFGPWFGNSRLPAAKDDAGNRMPDDAGGDGLQDWALVGNWNVFGPVVSPAKGYEVAGMPDFVPLPFMRTKFDRRMASRNAPEGIEFVRIENAAIETGSGFTTVPLARQWKDKYPEAVDLPFSSTYAWTEIHSATDTELWVGMTVNDHGRLWVNEQLVWSSPRMETGRHMESTHIFKVNFKQGVNRIFVRNDNYNDDGYFAMRVCVRGGPRSGRQVVAAIRDAGSPYGESRGWRNDFSGVYENADPPMAWDPHEKINVRWIKEMDEMSYSAPLIIGERVYTFAEPNVMLCVNKADGSEVWRNVLDVTKAPNAPSTGQPRMDWLRDIGYTYPTPVTDGRHIYVKFCSGLLACVDTEGDIKWLVNHELIDGDASANVPSPLLIDGKVIVFGRENGRLNVLKAFNAETGEQLWRAATFMDGMFSGTPAALRLSNGRETMDVIITANGTLVRADDGKVLRIYIGAHEKYGSPVADGNRFTISHSSSKSIFELLMIDRDTVGVRRRWLVNHPGIFQDGNYGFFHDEKLYFSRPLLDVTDIESGDLLWTSHNIFFCRPGRGYNPPALAGGRIYAADNAQWFQPTYRPSLTRYSSAMAVLEMGDPPMQLSCNFIDRINGAFTLHGDSIYVRGARGLMRIAHTGDEGRAWEAETVATELLYQIANTPPAAGPVMKVDETASQQGRWGPSTSNPAELMVNWAVAGPLPSAALGEAVAKLTDGALLVRREEGQAELSAGGQTVSLKIMGGGNYQEWAEDVPFGLLERERFSRGPHIGWQAMMGDRLGLYKVLPAEAGTIGIMACILSNDSAGRYRFDSVHPDIRAFIGGKEVKHNQVVELPQGDVVLVLALQLDPAGKEQPWYIMPRFFRPSEGDTADLAAWRKEFERRRPYFERVLKLAPGSAAGRRAGAVIAATR